MTEPIDLYLASGNAHKVREFEELLAAAGSPHSGWLRLHSARDVGGMPPVVEDAGTFEGNARIKALALLQRLPATAWALADDSGVCVDHLGGDPGVESAYFAGPQGDSAANLRKLVAVMQGVPHAQRRARFTCVLCLARHGVKELFFQGSCHGYMLDLPRGGGGFGYDPLFVPDGYEASFSELADGIKNRISHRSRAWGMLLEWMARAGRGGAGQFSTS